MRYIKKTTPLKKFVEYTSQIDLTLSKSELKRLFKKMPSEIKKELKKYILEKEQNYLCIYCEEKICSIENCHIEHVLSEDENPNLIFDYNNLVVSCNGDGKCNTENQGKNKKTTCGHKKANKQLPLNPLVERNISDYFKYEIIDSKTEIKITASNLDEKKATEMINILNLNSNSPNFNLLYRRWKEKENFEDFIYKEKLNKEDITKILQNFPPAFISCIKYFLVQKKII
jgi:uncharacterized protein (TIGR02646 family)